MQQRYAAFTTETKAIVGCLHAAAYFFAGYPKIELHATIAPLNYQSHEGEIEVTELYPDGKRLWLSVCDVRGVDHQRAEIEWAQWEEGFLTQGEWQRVAERFTASTAVSACGCETCRPITLSDMRMVLCSICGNKRCPHATDHRNACRNSNEPGQPGSSYGGMNTPAIIGVKSVEARRDFGDPTGTFADKRGTFADTTGRFNAPAEEKSQAYQRPNYRICEFCGCNTNAAERACCDRGREDDRAASAGAFLKEHGNG